MTFGKAWAIIIFAFAILAAPLAADAQQAGRVYRIGFLSNAPPVTPEAAQFLDAFKQRLRELGYVEGKNFVIETRFAEGRPERFPDLARELMRLNADIIVTVSGTATSGAKQATTTIPIVMTGAVDPVASGLVASLARPGGNITGVVDLGVELSPKRLELLKEVVPKASRIASLASTGFAAGRLEEAIKAEEAAAKSLGLTLVSFRVSGSEGFDDAFAAIARGRFDGLLVAPSPPNLANRTRIAEFALKNRLPSIHGYRESVVAGGFMSYGGSLTHRFQRAAIYVDKILTGAKPADLPVEQSSKFELVINLKTAKALGLTIPQSVLIRANEVIQ